MTTFSPFASVVLSIAICSRFTLIPLSFLLWLFCSTYFFPARPASPRNPAQEPVRPSGLLLHRPVHTAPASPSLRPSEPLQHRNLRAKAAPSTRRANRDVRSFPALAVSGAAEPAWPLA